MEYNKLEKVLKILEDENRLRILHMLNKTSRCACELLLELNITQPTLSYHMKMLVNAELVHSEKRGKWQYYSINIEMADSINQNLGNIFYQKSDNMV